VGITAARDLLLTQFEWGAATEPLLDTEKRMNAHQLGAIPVRDDQGRMSSVLTRRTLAHLRGEDVDLTRFSAGDVARPVTPVQAGESLEAVLESLRVQQVGRLPVTDEGVEIGIITRGDVLGYLDIKERLGPKIADLVVDVSPNDEMFHGNLVAYLANGVSAVEAVKRAQAAAGKETLGAILDFACGHGRVLRALKAEFPHANLAACDVNADGVQFCARTFGARPLLSHRDPGQIELKGEFDLVWCASLLTHLDAGLWSPFLRLFESVLKPSGLLVFTVLGRAGTSELSRTFRGTPGEESRVRTVLEGYEARGFGYSDYWRQPDYGLSLCTPEWVAQTLATQDRLRLLHHEEGALMGSQDIVACQAMD
jgi:SAM-dependent methyltransferase